MCRGSVQDSLRTWQPLRAIKPRARLIESS
jgi:hypothetical protein